MENPFELISKRLDNIENLLFDIQSKLDERNSNSQNDQLLSIKEVAKYLNLSVPTIYGYTAKRHIPHAKRGNRLYFNKSEIDNWILEGEQRTNSDIERMASDYLSQKGIRHH